MHAIAVLVLGALVSAGAALPTEFEGQGRDAAMDALTQAFERIEARNRAEIELEVETEAQGEPPAWVEDIKTNGGPPAWVEDVKADGGPPAWVADVSRRPEGSGR